MQTEEQQANISLALEKWLFTKQVTTAETTPTFFPTFTQHEEIEPGGAGGQTTALQTCKAKHFLTPREISKSFLVNGIGLVTI